MTEESIGTVVDLMRNGEREATKMQAAQFLIERGWGKAVDRVEITGEDGEAIQQTTELVIKVIGAKE